MINADDFLFNSNFYYNYPAQKGYVDKSAISIPATILLCSGVTINDRFKVVTEVSGTVYQKGGPFPNVNYYVKDGNLYAVLSAQSSGQTWTGRIHYRVYKNVKGLSFNSNNQIEKVIFSVHGQTPGDGTFGTSIPNTYGDTMLLTGMWRNVTKNSNLWFPDGSFGYDAAGAYMGSMGLSNTKDNINISFGSDTGSDAIEYKIVGVKLNDYS